MAARTVNNIYDLRKEQFREVFQPPQFEEHRFEYVAKKHGVDYINDSKATNINSTWFSLEKLTTETVLILGGQQKEDRYEEIRDLVKEKVTNIVCIGKDNKAIARVFNTVVDNIFEAASMKEAVHAAKNFAYPDHTVLLSPAAASFDLFENYADR